MLAALLSTLPVSTHLTLLKDQVPQTQSLRWGFLTHGVYRVCSWGHMGVCKQVEKCGGKHAVSQTCSSFSIYTTINSIINYLYYLHFVLEYILEYTILLDIIYNVVLVSALQRSKPTVCIHTPVLSWTSLSPAPQSQPSGSSEPRAELPVLYGSFSLAVSHVVVCICQSYSLSSSHPPLSPLYPYDCSLYQQLYSCPEIFTFIGTYLIYNVGLVSGIQQSDSVVHIHMSILFKFVSYIVHYRVLSRVPCAIQ